MPLPESLRKVLDARKAVRDAMPATKPERLERGVDETIIWRDGRIYKNSKLLSSRMEKSS